MLKNRKWNNLGRLTEEGESPVHELKTRHDITPSSVGHEKSCVNPGGPPSKAKYYLLTDREEYREGKVKRTPGGE